MSGLLPELFTFVVEIQYEREGGGLEEREVSSQPGLSITRSKVGGRQSHGYHATYITAGK